MSIRYWLYAIALGGCLIGSAVAVPDQSLPEKQRAPLQKTEETNSHNSEPEERKSKQPKDIGIAGTNVLPPKMTGNPERGNAEAKPTKQTEDTSYLFWGEGFAQWGMAITGLLAFAVSIYAVCLLKSTLIVTQRTLKAAAKANTITGMAIREAAISSERELRAYILIEQVEMIELLPQKPYRIKIRAVNFGQTPAKNFRLVWGSDIVSTEIINDIDYTVPEIAIGSRSILGPDDDNFAFVESRIWLLPETYEALRKEDDSLIVWGKIWYEDIFGKRRWTTFRYRCAGKQDIGSGKGRFRALPDGNDYT